MEENLKKLLTNPFENIKDGNIKDFQKECKKIATKLLKDYCIQCGNKYYYFAEIEFYYYDKEKWNEEWNEKTYPRNNKNAGDFFFHYSGVDICFYSKFEEGKFGGILIRSLKDENGNFITGPSVCMLEILNTCFEQKMNPSLEKSQNDGCIFCEQPIARYGITYKDKQEDKKLCFYDERLKAKQKNEFANAKWDYTQNTNGEVKGINKLVRYYKRFE